MEGNRLTAKIAVSSAVISIDKLYSYIVPADYSSSITVGQRVLVPFGRNNKQTHGIVVELNSAAQEECKKLKEIIYLYSDEVMLSHEDMSIASFIKNRCFCTFFDAANVLLPPGIWSRNTEVFLPGEFSYEYLLTQLTRSPKKAEIVKAVYHALHPVTCADIVKKTGIKTASTHLRELISLGYVTSKQKVIKPINDKFITMVEAAMSIEEAEALLPRGKLTQRRLDVLRCLSQSGTIPEAELCYLTGVTSSLISGLVTKGFINRYKTEIYRRPEIKASEREMQIDLNPSQQQAFDDILALMDGTARGCLLHGITGSGKTEIYIKLIKEALNRGRSAVLLVPEIALTPQMVRRFYIHFGEDIAIIHSGLTSSQRYDEYKRIRQGRARIVVGTRSAIFAPLMNIGIIIIDEEQEFTYKSENTPRYHAVDIAKFRSAYHKCLVLMGSATPSVETYWLAQKGKISLVELTKRYNKMPLPRVIVSDMRGQVKNGSISTIGPELAREISDNLKNKEKTILFLNKRGASRKLQCVDCGHIPECKNCSVPLVYHSKNNRLLCHHCGYSEPSYVSCPVCGSFRLRYEGIGTQKVETELSELFPGIRIVRMDADTIVGRTSHEKLIDEFAEGDCDILLGTQMVAKGLDFDNVTLVGVLDCDGFIYSEDFRAQERAFALITQVVGRAGRREAPGRAVIQTFTPDNSVINTAAVQDYKAFYSSEIIARQALKAAPFYDLFVFNLTGEYEDELDRAARSLASTITKASKTYTGIIDGKVLGPISPNIFRLNNKYRLTVSFRGKNTPQARALVEKVIYAYAMTPYNSKISLSVDINPYY